MLQRYIACGLFALALGLGATFVVAADKEGQKKEEEVKIDVKDLPKAVVDAIKVAFPTGTITEAEKETEDGKVIYDLDVKVGDKTFEVKASEDGKIISQKEETEDDEKDEKKPDAKK